MYQISNFSQNFYFLSCNTELKPLTSDRKKVVIFKQQLSRLLVVEKSTIFCNSLENYIIIILSNYYYNVVEKLNLMRLFVNLAF